MDFNKNSFDELGRLINGSPRNVIIATHTNPDGDAIGSSLAWKAFLESKGHTVNCVIPNRFPDFLDWLEGASEMKIYKNEPQEVAALVSKAEIIFCLDFNQIQRLEGLGECIEANKHSKFVLIDHHLSPPPGIFDLEISYSTCSSTSYLVYCIIEQLEGVEIITKEMAEQLYVGIMTDTGNFSFSFLTSDLFRAVAVLVDKGIDIPYINRMVYHSYTVGRLKLLGHTLNNMQTFKAGKEQAAYMTLKESELRRFHFQPGDSEGFVNYPLSIKGLALSAIFIETKDFIRISFRSRIDVDANVFASLYFNGGGHKNASGGKSFVSMEETVKKYRDSVSEFFAKDK